MKIFGNIDELKAAVGTHLGHSDWHLVDQDMVNHFADATGDHQWIHVDVERAKAGPFGSTIAHGYLTLALAPVLVSEILRFEGVSMAVNYGTNRVRFPAPLPVGSRVRGGSELVAVEDVPNGVQIVQRLTISADAAAKPCCVAETVSRLYLA